MLKKMKNSIIACAALFVLLSAGSGEARAQKNGNASISNPRATGKVTEPMMPLSGPHYTKAVRNFARTYKNVTNGTWTKVKDGFAAKFISDGIRYTVLYNVKGIWNGLVKNYTEEKLPRGIREIVKSKYYDYSIFYVDELETNTTGDTSVYIVHLEDKTGVKLVRVYNGEMDVWMEYVKG
jgi:hypothetical protein